MLWQKNLFAAVAWTSVAQKHTEGTDSKKKKWVILQFLSEGGVAKPDITRTSFIYIRNGFKVALIPTTAY